MNSGLSPQLTVRVPAYSVDDRGRWSDMLNIARAADAAGIDRLSVPDHVVFGEHLKEYARPEVGGMKGGAQPTGPDGHWLEPLTTLSVIAGMTSKIRLRTEILIAALRRPVVLAKSATTLDVLSGGRLDLGVGVGWQREEYEAAGLNFEGRGQLLNHTIEVCQRLWQERSASFTSPQLTFNNIHQMPKPVHEGGVPIWVSGTIRNTTIQRLLRFGMRWIPWGDDSQNLVDAIPRLKDAVAAAGGDTSDLKVSGELMFDQPNIRCTLSSQMDIRSTLEKLPILVEAGVTDFVFTCDEFSEYNEAHECFSNLVSDFRTVVGRAVDI